MHMDIGPGTKRRVQILYPFNPTGACLATLSQTVSVRHCVQASDTLSRHGVPNRLLIDTSWSTSCHLVKVKSCKSVIRESDIFWAGSLTATNELYYCVSPYDPTTLTLVGCIMMHRRSGNIHV